MARSKGEIAGVLFLVAGAQFVLGLTVAEALYPGYSLAEKYISDLGIGPSAVIFNSSAFLLGLLLLIGTYFLRDISNSKIISMLLFLTAFGAMGIGVFTKNMPLAHGAVASAAFFFAGLSAISSFRLLKKPLSLISLILGIMTLAALALFSSGMITSGSLTSNIAYDSDFYMGLGPGGIESMIVYPAVIWLIMFSGYLITHPDNKENT